MNFVLELQSLLKPSIRSPPSPPVRIYIYVSVYAGSLNFDCIYALIAEIYLFIFPGEFGAVFTYKWKGEELSKLVDNGTKVMIHITISEVCPRSPSNINR